MAKFLKTPTTPKVIFSSKAYYKHLELLDTPIGKKYEYMFLGTVAKTTKGDYLIEDIFTPPQENNFAHVETADEGAFQKYLVDKIGIQNLTKVRLHAHSHVNMHTTPSGTDETMINTTIDNVNDFFIQLIFNLRGNYTLNIYNKEENIIYDNVKAYVRLNNFNIPITTLNKEVNVILSLNISDYKNLTINEKTNSLILSDSLSFNFNTMTYNIYSDELIYDGKELVVVASKATTTNFTDEFTENTSIHKYPAATTTPPLPTTYPYDTMGRKIDTTPPQTNPKSKMFAPDYCDDYPKQDAFQREPLPAFSSKSKSKGKLRN